MAQSEPLNAILEAQRAIQHYNAVQHQIRQHQIAQLKRTTSQIPDQSVTFDKHQNFNVELNKANLNDFKDENSSDISARSKPNSNGHNVRFVDQQQVVSGLKYQISLISTKLPGLSRHSHWPAKRV